MKIAKTGGEFEREAKPYVVNMLKNRKMLHKKGCKLAGCLYRYEDFDAFDEALKMFPRVALCQCCFPEQKE